MQEKGHCKHGEFILSEGCPQCIEERRRIDTKQEIRAEEVPGIVIVCAGGCGKTTEGMTAENKSGEFKQVDESGVPEWTCQECLTNKELAAETALAKSPGADVQVMGYYIEALKIQEWAEASTITTPDDIKAATEGLSIIAKLKVSMEAKRKEYTSPLRSQVEAINETYKILMRPIEVANTTTRNKMLAYNKEQEDRRREQERINAQKLEVAEAERRLSGKPAELVELIEIPPDVPKHVSTDLGATGQRANWTFEVFDFALLPDEYKVVDSAMLNSIAKKHHDQKQIPGVRFVNKPIITVRTK